MNIQVRVRFSVLLCVLLFFFSSCGVPSGIHTVDTLDLLKAELVTLLADALMKAESITTGYASAGVVPMEKECERKSNV